jgi:hypothetical protein
VGPTFTALTVLATASISTLVVTARASISTLAVSAAASFTGITVTGPATFSTIEILKTAVFDAEVNRATFSTTSTIDWQSGKTYRVVLGGAITFNFVAPPGTCNLILKLVQDGTGSRNPAWPAAVKWAGGAEPTWSTAAAAIDLVSFYYDGTSYYGVGATGFA